MILATVHVPKEIDHTLNKCMGGRNIDTEIVAISIRDFEQHDACECDHGVEVVRYTDYATTNVGVPE